MCSTESLQFAESRPQRRIFMNSSICIPTKQMLERVPSPFSTRSQHNLHSSSMQQQQQQQQPRYRSSSPPRARLQGQRREYDKYRTPSTTSSTRSTNIRNGWSTQSIKSVNPVDVSSARSIYSRNTASTLSTRVPSPKVICFNSHSWDHPSTMSAV